MWLLISAENSVVTEMNEEAVMREAVSALRNAPFHGLTMQLWPQEEKAALSGKSKAPP